MKDPEKLQTAALRLLAIFEDYWDTLSEDEREASIESFHQSAEKIANKPN